MQKIALPGFALLTAFSLLPACRPKPAHTTAHTDTIAHKDSSLLVTDSVHPMMPVDTTPVPLDSLVITEEQLLGKWTRPVQGVDNATEGFEMRKLGKMRNLNSSKFSVVYDKWELKKDTLILNGHQPLVKEPVQREVTDTTIVRGITDTSLVLFPIRAADGYEERYARGNHRK